MDLRFVLVSPALAENVGAAARALKTMGFSGLRLVGSGLHREEKALWTAHGSREILEQAETFAALEDALADRDFVIATTARRRGRRREYYPPEALPRLITDKGCLRPALVFGCEESGLSNADLEICDCASSIPLAAPYPSLNLAQAVMLYAYILAPLGGGLRKLRPKDAAPRAGAPEFRALKQRAAALLSRLRPSGDLVERRALERLAALGGEDIKLAHSLCSRLEKALAATETPGRKKNL